MSPVRITLAALLCLLISSASPADLTLASPRILDGVFPAPATVRNMERFLEEAGAGPDQMLAAARAHEQMMETFEELSREALSVLRQLQVLSDQFQGGELPDPARLHAATATRDRLRLQMEANDAALREALHEILPGSEEILRDLTRSRARARLVTTMPGPIAYDPFLNTDLLGFVRAQREAINAEQYASALQRARSFDDSVLQLGASVLRELSENPIEFIVRRALEDGLAAGTPIFDVDDQMRRTLIAPIDAALRAFGQHLQDLRRLIFSTGSRLLLEAMSDLDALLCEDVAWKLRMAAAEVLAPRSAGALRDAWRTTDAVRRAALERAADTGETEIFHAAINDLHRALQEVIKSTVQSEVHRDDDATSDNAREALDRRIREGRARAAALAEEAKQVWSRHVHAPIPGQDAPQETLDAIDDPRAAAFGEEVFSNLSIDQVASIDWALLPPIRRVHLAAWQRLLDLDPNETEVLRNRVSESAALTREEPAARQLEAFARRRMHRLSDDPGIVPLGPDDMSALARARLAASEAMLASDEAFFTSLAKELGLGPRHAALLRTLQDDRTCDVLLRPLRTLLVPLELPRDRAWQSSPIMLLLHTSDLDQAELVRAIEAAGPHIAQMSNAARAYFRAAVRILEVEERLHLTKVAFPGREDERAAEHVLAAVRALDAAFHAAGEAMIAVLAPHSALRFERRLRTHVYAPHFSDEPTIGSEIFEAIERSDHGHPRTEALTELLLSWREADERIVREMIEQMRRPAPSNEEARVVRNELALLSFLRGQLTDRTALRLIALTMDLDQTARTRSGPTSKPDAP